MEHNLILGVLSMVRELGDHAEAFGSLRILEVLEAVKTFLDGFILAG